MAYKMKMRAELKFRRASLFLQRKFKNESDFLPGDPQISPWLTFCLSLWIAPVTHVTLDWGWEGRWLGRIPLKIPAPPLFFLWWKIQGSGKEFLEDVSKAFENPDVFYLCGPSFLLCSFCEVLGAWPFWVGGWPLVRALLSEVSPGSIWVPALFSFLALELPTPPPLQWPWHCPVHLQVKFWVFPQKEWVRFPQLFFCSLLFRWQLLDSFFSSTLLYCYHHGQMGENYSLKKYTVFTAHATECLSSEQNLCHIAVVRCFLALSQWFSTWGSFASCRHLATIRANFEMILVITTAVGSGEGLPLQGRCLHATWMMHRTVPTAKNCPAQSAPRGAIEKPCVK